MTRMIAIAVTADVNDEASRRHYLNDSYATALYRAGGLPLAAPAPDLAWEGRYGDWAGELMNRVDGLLLSGGADVDAARYGRGNRPVNGVFSEERDGWEIALIQAAIQAGKPVLGICRGIQILNVALGGTLIQDIEAAFPDGDVLAHRQKAPAYSPTHDLRVLEDSLLAGIFGHCPGSGPVRVNSFHHQAVDEAAPGYRVSARAPDGIVEAIEPEDGADGPRFVLGVQWHPERMEARHAHAARLFTAFVAACGGGGGLGGRGCRGGP